MGLGSKIKEALHSDHHDKATSDVKPPGAFPQDDIPQKHADGGNYIAPHGSLVDKNRNTTGQTAGLSGTTASGTAGPDSLGSSGTQRHKLHKEGEGYIPSDTSQTTHGHKTADSGIGLGQTSGKDRTSEGAYWGDLSSGGHPSKTGSAQHNPLHGDQVVGGGVYNTVAGAGSPDYDRSHGSGKPHASGGAVHDPLTSSTKGTSVPSGSNEYDYKTSLGGSGAPTSRDDRTGPALASAGGIGAGYGADELAHRGHGNTHSQHSDIRGTGAPGYGNDHSGVGASERGLSQGGLNHQGGLSQGGLSQGGLSQGSSSRGLTGGGLSSGGGLSGNGLSGSNVGRSAGYGDNDFTHHDQSTGHGHGHAGAGLAGAGVGAAAGYGATELAHRGQGNTGHSGTYESTSSQHVPGVPRSSMLDVEPSAGVTGSHPGHTTQASGVPHNASLGSERGVTGSPTHNTSLGSDRGVSGSPTNVSSGLGQSSPTSSSTHYGPGHPGAKVMHRCQHCGNDNDISHYFKSDVVYRLGQ
ncbi:hypothetical protein J7T55_012758 [Diaporthe amygdali]|uniref:uncharacterized protein n=1 Tax=Phomopsis amygdali TaxID=1214568 RepID=UPI0022FF184B|nr:uncharacterized protein J7T55_012758 [Diaporthe amygdali]KAJ0115478.1 hypothetical protein J7T55_012758 [Diaporthe amygdali]